MSAKPHVPEISPPVANSDGVAITPFTAVANALPSPNPLDELSIELARVVKAIKESDSAKASGEVNLTLSIRKAENVLDAVVLKAEVTAKVPKKPKMAGLLFADDDGVLSERNPNQREMFEGPRSAT
jgi:hypothetical protein